MLSLVRSAWCTKAELNGNVDSENNHGGSSTDIMYYIGLDVHKKTISYCVKDASGQVHQEGKIGATRRELDGWMETLAQPWTVAMEATIFTGCSSLRFPSADPRSDSSSAPSAAPAGAGSAGFGIDRAIFEAGWKPNEELKRALCFFPPRAPYARGGNSQFSLRL